jgi:hypothetical protein
VSAVVLYNHSAEIATVSNTFKVDGVATDPTTVSLVVTDPDGNATTYTYGASQIDRASAGAYSKDISCSSTNAGRWIAEFVGTGAASDVEPLTWTTYEPARQYAALAELRGRVDRTDTVRDDELLAAIEAASRQVDDDTGRRFWLDSAVSARVFNPRYRILRTDEGQQLLVDDIGSTAGLVVEIGSVSAGVFTGSAITDYEVLPDNSPTSGWPVTSLLRPLNYWRITPLTRVRITARWGWPRVPTPIHDATLLLAHRRYRRRGSPEGVAGFGDMGVVRVSRYDPDYDKAISRYILPGFA